LEYPTWGGPKHFYERDFKLATSFWDAVSAARWGKDGRVLFELWNEAIFGKEDWQPEVDEQRIRVDSRHPYVGPPSSSFPVPASPASQRSCRSGPQCHRRPRCIVVQARRGRHSSAKTI